MSAATPSGGRIYLPQEDLRRFGCTDADLRAGMLTGGRPPAAGIPTAAARREYYASAAELLPRLDRRALVAAEIMGRIYRETLDRIERAGYDVFSQLIRVPRPAPGAIAADTWLRTRFGRHVPA